VRGHMRPRRQVVHRLSSTYEQRGEAAAASCYPYAWEHWTTPRSDVMYVVPSRHGQFEGKCVANGPSVIALAHPISAKIWNGRPTKTGLSRAGYRFIAGGPSNDLETKPTFCT